MDVRYQDQVVHSHTGGVVNIRHSVAGSLALLLVASTAGFA
jgi:hypothetical protein